ncbi:hypothetical protein NHF53_04770 [Ciceribacter sp. RN22]|nr:hypothetical protein [Ciceribacter sp. RN22]MCO6177413.1 hypothetical protein [Ciceribacter sp. RN22]
MHGADAIAPFGLGQIEHGVGRGEKKIERRAPLALHRHADADGDGERSPFEGDRPPLDRLSEGIGDGACLFEPRSREEAGELLAAEPCDGGVFRHVPPQQFRERHQYAVTGQMSVGIVDLLEVIEVADQHRGRFSRSRKHLLRLRDEGAAVVEPRQRIGFRRDLVAALGAVLGEHGDREHAEHVGERRQQRQGYEPGCVVFLRIDRRRHEKGEGNAREPEQRVAEIDRTGERAGRQRLAEPAAIDLPGGKPVVDAEDHGGNDRAEHRRVLEERQRIDGKAQERTGEDHEVVRPAVVEGREGAPEQAYTDEGDRKTKPGGEPEGQDEAEPMQDCADDSRDAGKPEQGRSLVAAVMPPDAQRYDGDDQRAQGIDDHDGRKM